MKIKEYQDGGIIYTPFISSRGVTNPPTSTTKTSSEKDKVDNTIQKEIINVLKESGIQSDVDMFLSTANSFLNKSKHLSGMSLFGGDDPEYSMTDLVTVLQLANNVKQNKLQWDEAAANLKAQNAWNEAAIASNGYLYVASENGLETISVSDYYKNQDKYQVLTNSQLLGLREKDHNMAFNSDILKDMAGTISLNKITDQLLETISKFDSTTRVEYINKTGENISQSAWNGIQLLIDKGPNGYYKATTKSELVNIKSALDYLWSSLGADGQKRLRAEVAVSGGDPDKNRYDLIAQMLTHHTEFSQTVDFDKSATEYDPDGDGKSDAKPQLEDDPYLSVIAKGKGIREQLSLTPSTKNPMGEQIGLKVWGINIGPLIDKNGNIIEQTSLPDALKRGEVFRGRPDNNVTFGNKILTPEEQKTIITDENAIVYMVEMPYRETINGVVPDFNMIDVYEKVNNLLKDTTNNIQRTELLIQYGIDPSKLTIDEKGNWSLKTKLFTRVPGYISEDLTELTDDNKRFMDPVDESEGNQKRKLFNKILKYGIQNPGKNTDAVHSTWNWFGGGDWDRGDMHRGYFYVTAPDEWIAALLTGQNKIDKHLLTDIDKRIYMNRAQQDSPLITQF